eukprot:GFKZ01005257.1.p1 GENE.GFKZ01005257.1~~GFKZ01005257.1.p1  ORF type:complete len:136 (+),score=19.49 GFKZ01005257.1:294-701(+)
MKTAHARPQVEHLKRRRREVHLPAESQVPGLVEIVMGLVEVVMGVVVVEAAVEAVEAAEDAAVKANVAKHVDLWLPNLGSVEKIIFETGHHFGASCYKYCTSAAELLVVHAESNDTVSDALFHGCALGDCYIMME